MLRELARAFEDASWDDEIRAVVVTGTGRAFCVGADLQGVGRRNRRQPAASTGSGSARSRTCTTGSASRQADGRPRQGIAVGGGNELQMACDPTVMVDTAFIHHVGPGSTVGAGRRRDRVAADLVGDRRAREIIILCDEPAR